MQAHSGGDLPRRAVLHPGEPALSRVQGPQPKRPRSVLTSLFGSDVARAKLDEIRATFSEDHRPRLATSNRHAGGISHDRLGRHHARGVPAARRHQRHLLLRRDAVAARRLLREPVACDQHRLRGCLDRRLSRYHCGHRQDRPQAAAADRLGGHGGDPCSRWSMRSATDRSTPTATSCSRRSGHDRRGRRQPLRDLLQLQLGPGDVGHARRDVPEPDPRIGARGRGLRPVVRELPHFVQLPGDGCKARA